MTGLGHPWSGVQMRGSGVTTGTPRAGFPYKIEDFHSTWEVGGRYLGGTWEVRSSWGGLGGLFRRIPLGEPESRSPNPVRRIACSVAALAAHKVGATRISFARPFAPE